MADWNAVDCLFFVINFAEWGAIQYGKNRTFLSAFPFGFCLALMYLFLDYGVNKLNTCLVNKKWNYIAHVVCHSETHIESEREKFINIAIVLVHQNNIHESTAFYGVQFLFFFHQWNFSSHEYNAIYALFIGQSRIKARALDFDWKKNLSASLLYASHHKQSII